MISVYKQSNITLNKQSYCQSCPAKPVLAMQFCCSAAGLHYLESSQKTLCPWRMKRMYIFLSCTSNKTAWLFDLLVGRAEVLLLLICKGQAELSVTSEVFTHPSLSQRRVAKLMAVCWMCAVVLRVKQIVRIGGREERSPWGRLGRSLVYFACCDMILY